MAPSRPSAKPFAFRATLLEAGGIFLFSAVFGVLFDLFYTEGIELKVEPPKPVHLQEILKSRPAAYAGWGKPAAAPSPSPSPAPGADGLPRLSLIGAKDRFDRKAAVFLDARSPEEYREGHIPGALDFYADDFEKMAPQVLPQLPNKDREIVAYCHGTSCDLSIHLAEKLAEQGYTHVDIFFGGWPEWKKAGYPIRQGNEP
ncbi:MAG TPA: rhodanese-like domain-containing protein [bacterium]|nr:rhodanese-like domain-containing protein [bacterium]